MHRSVAGSNSTAGSVTLNPKARPRISHASWKPSNPVFGVPYGRGTGKVDHWGKPYEIVDSARPIHARRGQCGAGGDQMSVCRRGAVEQRLARWCAMARHVG